MKVERNLLREWILKHSQKQRQKEIDNMVFTSYAYEKYGEMVLAFMKGQMNIQLCNLSS